PQSVWWNDLAGRDECARRHQGTRAHTSTTEDGCPDPDEGTFLHDRAVHHGLVSQAHIVVQDRGLTGIGVHTALVLDVDLVPDHDFLTVGPQHSAVPDTALGADAYAADHDRTGCDPCGGIDLRGPEGSTADVRPRRVGNQVLCCAVHVALSTVLTGVSVISWVGGVERKLTTPPPYGDDRAYLGRNMTRGRAAIYPSGILTR